MLHYMNRRYYLDNDHDEWLCMNHDWCYERVLVASDTSIIINHHHHHHWNHHHSNHHQWQSTSSSESWMNKMQWIKKKLPTSSSDEWNSKKCKRNAMNEVLLMIVIDCWWSSLSSFISFLTILIMILMTLRIACHRHDQSM